METPDATVKTRETAETVVFVIGVAATAVVSAVVLRKFAGYVSDRTVDAVVNTLTRAKSKKQVPAKTE